MYSKLTIIIKCLYLFNKLGFWGLKERKDNENGKDKWNYIFNSSYQQGHNPSDIKSNKLIAKII